MNNPKSKRPPGETGMSSREIEASIRRIEDDLYFSSDNIKNRLTRIEEKLDHVTTRDDLKAFATRDDLKAFATRDHLKAFATRDDLKAFATKEDLKAFATKEDLKAFATREDLKAYATRDDLKVFAARDDLKVFATREDLANLKISMIRWSVGSMLALTGTVVTAFKFFLP